MVEMGKTAESWPEMIGDRNQGSGSKEAEGTQIQVSKVFEYLS